MVASHPIGHLAGLLRLQVGGLRPPHLTPKVATHLGSVTPSTNADGYGGREPARTGGPQPREARCPFKSEEALTLKSRLSSMSRQPVGALDSVVNFDAVCFLGPAQESQTAGDGTEMWLVSLEVSPGDGWRSLTVALGGTPVATVSG